jgi:hypothetical protein
MRNPRFRALLVETINGADHPDVIGVEEIDRGPQGEVLRISFRDGVKIDLMVVNSAPDRGDNHRESETIVRKQDLVAT